MTKQDFDDKVNGLTLKRLDNLASTYGEEPLMYAFTQYLNYISNKNKAQSYINPQATYPQNTPGSTLENIMAAASARY